jgi:glycosyltransferase involved in cell wall biosynthesis
MLDARKGIDLLLQAFADAALPPGDRLLLVGRADPQIRSLLDGRFAPLVRDGRVIVFDKYVTDEELERALLASDLVATPYPRHIGSASIVIRAAAAGRPVLGSEFGWSGYVIPKFGLGTTCDVTDPRAIAGSLAAAMETAAAFRLPPAGERFVRFHGLDNFQAAWTFRLRQRLGLPPGDYRSWDWVLNGDEGSTL